MAQNTASSTGRCVFVSALSTIEDATQTNTSGSQQNLLAALILKEDNSGDYAQGSIFRSCYEEIAPIGKGGFGKVYKATDRADRKVYAIKHILICNEVVSLTRNKSRQSALLMEARTLSKLQHENIVRYYGAWVQTRPAEESSTSSLERSYPGLPGDDLLRKFGLPILENESKIEVQGADKSPEHNTQRMPDASGHTLAVEATKEPSNDQKQSNRSVQPLGSLAEHLRAVHLDQTQLHTQEKEAIQGSERPEQKNLNILLFIKMELYPMTLGAFIGLDLNSKAGGAKVKHCFHTPTATGIIGAILNGLEHMHGKGIIHRDLKPTNILLSVDHGPKSAFSSAVEITRCPQCAKPSESKQIFITPHISDFGLAAEMKLRSDAPHPSQGRYAYESTEKTPAGSKFYLPPTETHIVCPKLDIYSLGVIAMELLHEFDSSGERTDALRGLKHGIIPSKFVTHKMAFGIRGMTFRDRDGRWDCTTIRSWLEKTDE